MAINIEIRVYHDTGDTSSNPAAAQAGCTATCRGYYSGTKTYTGGHPKPGESGGTTNVVFTNYQLTATPATASGWTFKGWDVLYNDYITGGLDEQGNVRTDVEIVAGSQYQSGPSPYPASTSAVDFQFPYDFEEANPGWDWVRHTFRREIIAIYAQFEQGTPPATYTVTAAASPSNGGTVQVGSAASGSTSTLTNITAGSTITVVATPETGYHFVSWSDGGAQTHDVTVNSDIDLTATFEYVGTVTITIQANDFGLVRFKGQAVDPQRGPIQMEVSKNSSVTIEAFSRYNSKFRYWHILNGSDYYYTREITIGATGNWTVHAEFVQVIEAHARLLNNPDATCQFGEVRIVPRNESATAWGQDVRVEIHSSQEVYVEQRSTVVGWALDHFWSKDTSTGSETSVYQQTWSNVYQGSSYGYIVNALFSRSPTNLLVNSSDRTTPVQLVYDPETDKLVADY